MDEFEKKLRELERSIDGEPTRPKPITPDEPAPATEAQGADSSRVLRWTAIGVGAGIGLAIAWVLLKTLLPLLVVLLLAGGVGYGGYLYLQGKSKKHDEP